VKNMMAEAPGDFFFTGVPIFIGIIFIIVIGFFIFIIINGISTWNKNNNSPRINSNAKVVPKEQVLEGAAKQTSITVIL
jgi:uncharacterized alpha/beta hydrolase family protein